MTALLWLTVALPLVTAVVARAAGPRSGGVAIAGATAAAVAPVALLVAAADGTRATSRARWLEVGGLDVGLRLDALSALMSVIVGLVGLVVLVYSTGYFLADRRAPSALAGLLAFIAAMQGLVLADGYLALLVFWELVGAASARLIAFTRDDPAAAPGAVRAFLTTRSADVGLYLALIALVTATGSVAFGQGRPAGVAGAFVGAGLVLAAMGKSAQAPLQSWLAGAMAGPTPVSALLHSATMVAAGVYLLVRSAPLLSGWPLEIAGWVGALTAVAAAAIALAQRDLKRVLAGSTASQLGLMFVGAAAGGPAVAIFHLLAHALGKAGLFLATGVFQHARGSVELERLRGAGRDDPQVFAGFAACALSIAAVPPFAAFWSKEQITAAAHGHTAWLVLVLLSAAGSAAYLLRPALILFDRGPRQPATTSGRRPMLAAVALLATASATAGALLVPVGRLLGTAEPGAPWWTVVLSLAAVATGAACVVARVRVPRALRSAAERELYTRAAVRRTVEVPVAWLARTLTRAETKGLDRAVDGTGRVTLAAARLGDDLERRGIDAAVDGLAASVGRTGSQTRRLQSGRLHEYLRDAVLGAAAIAVLITIAAVT